MRKRSILRLSVLGVIAIALLAAFLTAFMNDDKPVGIGDMAPDFMLTTVEDEQIRLSDYEGQGVYLSFWATWCQICKRETPIKQELYEERKDTGIEILSINLAEGKLPVSRYAERYELTFPIPLDRDRTVARLYGVNELPASFFIAPDGTVVATQVGMLSKKQMSEYLDLIQPES